jgi:hypothetical protein
MVKTNTIIYDTALKSLEIECDKLNYKIDNDIYYLECCNILGLYENELNALKREYYFNKIQSALQYLLKNLHCIKKIM